MFLWSRIPTIFFFLHQCYAPSFSDLEQEYAHKENMEYEQLAVFVATCSFCQTTCVRKKSRNAVGTYCSGIDRRFIGH